MSLVGCIAIPINLFWFAWNNSPPSYWLISITAQAPFGFAFILVYVSILNYLIDAYNIYSASVLAANTMLRFVFGAAFPSFLGVSYPCMFLEALNPQINPSTGGDR